MCNIAGYAGTEKAAPKLLEMLRRQQAFDGGVCTGIATIHDGRIFYRKVFGDVVKAPAERCYECKEKCRHYIDMTEQEYKKTV